jgi:osmotically-inducible protein OsmY
LWRKRSAPGGCQALIFLLCLKRQKSRRFRQTQTGSVCSAQRQAIRNGGNMIDDKELYNRVWLALKSDPMIDPGKIEVLVKDGTVTFKGKVSTKLEKMSIERMVKHIDGVQAIIDESLLVQ